jgi:hypothetical protein
MLLIIVCNTVHERDFLFFHPSIFVFLHAQYLMNPTFAQVTVAMLHDASHL